MLLKSWSLDLESNCKLFEVKEGRLSVRDNSLAKFMNSHIVFFHYLHPNMVQLLEYFEVH